MKKISKWSSGSKIAAGLVLFLVTAVMWGISTKESPVDIETMPKSVQSNMVDIKKKESFELTGKKYDTAIKDKSDLYKVVRVVDGDTIDVVVDGVTERLRLIGVDTPETVHPYRSVECYGLEATAKMKELALGKEIRLEADSSQGEIDKYERLLRYIHLPDGTNVIEKMIREGYGYEYTYSSSYKYQTLFKAAQNHARDNNLGVWGCENEERPSKVVAPEEAFTVSSIIADPAVAPETQEPTSEACAIKGNINSDKKKMYHLESCPSYEKTKIDVSKGEMWFCSEEEATYSGWALAGNC